MAYKIDIERTKDQYRKELDSFMESFIMTCSPYETDLGQLESEAATRAGKVGFSFLQVSEGFCSFRTIDKVTPVHTQGYNPYLDIVLSHSADTLTSNWFKWPCRPCFEVAEDGGAALGMEFGLPTYTSFLDIEGTGEQLQYLKDNVGGKIIECYRFSSVNDFHKQRSCYRFARTSYLRESILLTQAFVLDYIEQHPLDCFGGPYIHGEGLDVSACAGKTKLELLNPILEGYRPRLRERKEQVMEELALRGLSSESI